MAIFKPESKGTAHNGFMGVKGCSIKNWEDKSDQWDWADIFLSATLDIEGTDFDQMLEIKGGLEKENGKITGGAVLKRMYHLFDAIGCNAGLNIDGQWEDEDGNPIANMADYLNQRCTTFNPSTNEYTHLVYIYKKPSTKPGVNKAYTTVHTRMFPNTNDGRATLESHIAWMKQKGYLKEWTPEGTEAPFATLDNL